MCHFAICYGDLYLTHWLLSHFTRSHDSAVSAEKFCGGLWPSAFMIAEAHGWCLGGAGTDGLLP